MREVQVSEVKAYLSRLLEAVECGETLVIMRHGKPIARIVPEPERRREKIAMALADLEELRRSISHLTLDDFLSARHEGHHY